MFETTHKPGGVFTELQSLVDALQDRIQKSDKNDNSDKNEKIDSQQRHDGHEGDGKIDNRKCHVVFMSNGGFGGIQKIFLDALQNRSEAFFPIS